MPAIDPAAARTAILELVHRYFRCLDLHDAAGLGDCLAGDLEARHTLVGNLHGREAFLRVALASYPGLVTTQHYCSNEEIEFHDDRATCRAYLYAQHVVTHDGGPALLPGGGRYTFGLQRPDGTWRIHSLANEVTWMDPGLAAVFAPAR